MSGLISVKSALSDLEERDRIARGYVAGWQRSLQAVEEHVFPLFPGAATKTKDDWKQVRRCLVPESESGIIESTPRLLERVLHSYAQESRREQREDAEAVKAILEIVAAAATSARARTESYGGEFHGICEALGRLVRVEDPETLRRQLTREAANLRESVKQMVRESQESLTAMESDLRRFQQRLAEAEAAASTDVLTGLSNRRELERQLDTRVRRMSPFCVLLFDLDRFKSVNDRFGHECGDQLLRQVAAGLNEQVRPGDVVARWGGDEFVVIMDCKLQEALPRCRSITETLSRRYGIQWNGRTVFLPMRASSGVAEYICGETADTLFRRADEAMYAAKAARPGG